MEGGKVVMMAAVENGFVEIYDGSLENMKRKMVRSFILLSLHEIDVWDW